MLTQMTQYVSGERDFYKLNRISDDFLAYFHLLFTKDNYEIEHKMLHYFHNFYKIFQKVVQKEY